MRRAVAAAVLILAGAGALGVTGAAREASANEPVPGRVAASANPCVGPEAGELLCPDLVMTRPFGLRTDRRTRRGRVLLRAGNSIDSRGAGPAEVRGRRTGRRSMAARQQIVRRDGSRLSLQTGARLLFKAIPRQGRYWKLDHAARFELWSLDALGQRARLVRVGPKAVYCLRDLRRTHPSPSSPRRRIYPACSKSQRRRRVTLGTSVGWSDIYPPGYHEQWIDVTGLRGCFSYVHIADPRNRIHELREDNNEAAVTVSLPFGRGPDCGQSTGEGPPAVLLGPYEGY